VHAAGVFDGVGGLPHGEEAAVAAAQALGPLVRKGTPDAELLAALHAVVEATGGMTTAVVALARGGGEVGLVAVGDSSAYALRPDGSLERLVPHDADPDGLTACLGMAPLRRQARPWVLAPGQAMLLCTDGVDKVVPPEALAAALRAQDMEAALRTLLAQVLDEKAPDNLAAVLLRRVA
jgi:serine/threonine protein phosphatase PrpC